MNLGVICDGISRDLAHTLDVMAATGIAQAELQFVWDAEVGDHTPQQVREMDALLRWGGVPVCCLSRHIFAGMTKDNVPGDALHVRHMEALKRVIGMAQVLGSPLVRIMTPRKEQILWGAHGAEKWNVAHGAWDAMLPLIAPAVELARAEGVTLVVETGNGTMVNSAWTARRLIDDLGARDVLQVLWDPANACWCHETCFPDAYALLREGYVGHIHIKDVMVDTPKAMLEVRPMGQGQLAGQYPPLAEALRADGYAGVVSFESVYHPGNGDFEAGFLQNVGLFREIFG